MKPHRLRFVVTPDGPVETEDRPRRRSPFTSRKRAKLYKRPKYFVKPLPLDIDMTKLEKLSGGFCGCGQRTVEAVCYRCLDLDNWSDQ